MFQKKGIKQFLAIRQQELDQLDQRIAVLDDRLFERLGQLNRMQKDLEASRAQEGLSRADARALEEEIEKRKAAEEAALDNIIALKQQRNQLQSATVESEQRQREDEAARKQLKNDIKDIEEQNEVLEEAFQRTIELRRERYRNLAESRS
jgi:chromosome segregation ATPase